MRLSDDVKVPEGEVGTSIEADFEAGKDVRSHCDWYRIGSLTPRYITAHRHHRQRYG